MDSTTHISSIFLISFVNSEEDRNSDLENTYEKLKTNLSV
jgi:hypothetical protein